MNLSPREAQIVALLQQGKTNKEIGLALGLSQHTVRDNVSPMFARFGVKTRAALVAVLGTSFSSVPVQSAIGGGPTRQRAVDRRARVERRSVPRA